MRRRYSSNNNTHIQGDKKTTQHTHTQGKQHNNHYGKNHAPRRVCVSYSLQTNMYLGIKNNNTYLQRISTIRTLYLMNEYGLVVLRVVQVLTVDSRSSVL
jgi:hypothetical protein